MYEYLRQHPEIFMSELKEPHFFGSDLGKTPKFLDDYTGDIDRYLSLFAGAGTKAHAGEGSTMYLMSRNAASEIKDFSPSAKIIAMLRDPVDMLHSHHGQLVYAGAEDIEEFEEALDAEHDRKHGLRIPAGCDLIDGLYYREIAKYSEQLSRYFNAFGRDKVHVVNL